MAEITREDFEELAGMSEREFLGLNKRFDSLEGRVERGFELLAKRFDGLERKLADWKDDLIAVMRAAHEHEMDELKARVSRIEEKLGLKS